jgi:hypothetical protein
MLKGAFRVISAGPWDVETFGILDVEVVKAPKGLKVRLQERSGGAPIEFLADACERRGILVFLRTNAVTKWVLQALT